MTLYALDADTPSLPQGFFWIANTAVLVGKVEIGEEVGVWFGAVLRGDNEPIRVGARTNIQENCVLHTDMGFPLTIGAGCTIGHKAMIHGCTIGDNTLVGMNATVLNGAVIGNNCLIGAGALIKEGMQVPDNCLVVGMPGKIIRQVDDDGIKRLRRSADHYVGAARRFANGLKAVRDDRMPEGPLPEERETGGTISPGDRST